MSSYGQFCRVATAMKVLAERWILLVVRELHTGLRTLTEIWRGDVSWQRALGSGATRIGGPSEVRRSVPTWIGQGSFAEVPRIA